MTAHVRRTHLTKEDGQYTCAICTKYYSLSPIRVVRHIRESHTSHIATQASSSTRTANKKTSDTNISQMYCHPCEENKVYTQHNPKKRRTIARSCRNSNSDGSPTTSDSNSSSYESAGRVSPETDSNSESSE